MNISLTSVLTRSSAIAGDRAICCQLKSCQRLHDYEKSHLKRLATGKLP